MEQWLAYYDMANYSTHAGPHGSDFDLGHPREAYVPSGPSHFGHYYPLANSVIALLQATTPLLLHPNVCNVAPPRAQDYIEHPYRQGQLKFLERFGSSVIASLNQVFEYEQHVPVVVSGHKAELWNNKSLAWLDDAFGDEES